MTQQTNQYWTNKSVRLYSKGKDPIEKIEKNAREYILTAFEKGWTGPPYDPIKLAELNRINVVPNANIKDAQTVAKPNNKFVIEFNPNRSRGRIRFSIAHEIVHTFFPDCAEELRERHGSSEADDNWQLEMLCNIGAAELTMPIGSMQSEIVDNPTIHELLNLRKELDVSTEALLIRATKLSNMPTAVFAASRIDQPDGSAKYQIDYTIQSKSWPHTDFRNKTIKSDILDECTAIGYTVEGTETWQQIKLDIGCVGLPPYPGTTYPRIAGILNSHSKGRLKKKHIRFHEGDASEPGGGGIRIITHIVNDKTPNWGGGGFANALKRRHPFAQKDFRDWIVKDRSNLELGKHLLTKLNESTFVFSMIAQRGYGNSSSPRIRYQALEKCLFALGKIAAEMKASLHMPRIGTGNARGDWNVIQELIDEYICANKVEVNVYDYGEFLKY